MSYHSGADSRNSGQDGSTPTLRRTRRGDAPLAVLLAHTSSQFSHSARALVAVAGTGAEGVALCRLSGARPTEASRARTPRRYTPPHHTPQARHKSAQANTNRRARAAQREFATRPSQPYPTAPLGTVGGVHTYTGTREPCGPLQPRTAPDTFPHSPFTPRGASPEAAMVPAALASSKPT